MSKCGWNNPCEIRPDCECCIEKCEIRPDCNCCQDECDIHPPCDCCIDKCDIRPPCCCDEPQDPCPAPINCPKVFNVHVKCGFFFIKGLKTPTLKISSKRDYVFKHFFHGVDLVLVNRDGSMIETRSLLQGKRLKNVVGYGSRCGKVKGGKVVVV